uniref:Cytochrome P450 CYP736A12-like n=1 Tax=Nicotiana tabacum TaxID=4097 RepID=A0A1S3XMU1_TOBAC|nr:PREDICTED: cytochrome P450 CYP736A12-like [Nicotiana tabacum]
MRRLCTVHLSNSHKMNSFRSMRKKEVELLIESLKEQAHDHVAVDLSAKIMSLNANLTCLMVFGNKYMDEDLDKRGFKAVVQYVVRLAGTPNLREFFPFLGVIDLQGFTRKLKDLSKDMLIAAMDTSATSVEWILTELLRYPQAMKKLQRELEEVVGMDRMVEESDLENLKYLGMVVKEGLRLHSIVPLMHHEAMEDCVVNGFHIQKGSRIMINCYAIQRDPNVWPEPEKFLPERFVGSSIDIRGRHFQLLPFSSGRRSCPEMQLGITIVRLVVAQLVHCLDWEIPNGMQPLDLDVDEQFGIVLCKEKPLMVIPTFCSFDICDCCVLYLLFGYAFLGLSFSCYGHSRSFEHGPLGSGGSPGNHVDVKLEDLLFRPG